MTGVVVWVTGLPASGKTTLARAVHAALDTGAIRSVVLDGDDLRPRLGATEYDEGSRDRFYAQLSALAARVADQGEVAIVAATAPRRAHRAAARTSTSRFIEVYVATPLDECIARDPKGLYARARAGGAPSLPGVGAPYEAPERADVIASGGHDDAAVASIVTRVRVATSEASTAALCRRADQACINGDLTELTATIRALSERMPEPTHCDLVQSIEVIRATPRRAAAEWRRVRQQVLGAEPARAPRA